MKEPPQQVSESVRKLNPHLYGGPQTHTKATQGDSVVAGGTKTPKPRLNKTEARWKAEMVKRGMKPEDIMEQAIKLRLDPPFKSYTPDLAYLIHGFELAFVEVKGPHRFRRAGIAKAALAAKTYPMFRFELKEWDGKQWKESVLSK